MLSRPVAEANSTCTVGNDWFKDDGYKTADFWGTDGSGDDDWYQDSNG